MKLLKDSQGWLLDDRGKVARLSDFSLDRWLSLPDPLASLPNAPVGSVSAAALPGSLLPPLDHQEVWAAGVTYLRSRAARMEESDFSASAYDRVYEAARPELFFKASPRHCVGHGGTLKLRDDSKWMVPEPELVLVISASGKVIGFTIGDDLSCRDIEGENLLYLPQAKVWDRCCGLGPVILLNQSGVQIRESMISLEIRREGAIAFGGQTPISRIKRPFEELIGYLFRNQTFANGVLLFTGTGIVPPEDFTLKPHDRIDMTIPEIGTLTNTVE